MFRRLGILLAALALFTVAGGHWAVLQSVAWAQMLRDYSQNATVSMAIQKTFSGEYPCGMCRKIAEAKKTQEQTPTAVKADKKAEVFVARPAQALPAVASRNFSYGPCEPARFAVRTDAPPQPIPIVA